MQSPTLSAFRLGDVRGRYPEELDEEFAERFAHAFVRHFGITGTIATGRDTRPSGKALQEALNRGLQTAGTNVLDLGLCPTELGYFASTKEGIDAAIVVTASHNPPGDNGLKCVLAGGRAVTLDAGLAEVRHRMLEEFPSATECLPGRYRQTLLERDYIRFLASRFNIDELDIGSVALNGLNGTAATLAVDIAANFNIPVSWFRQEPGSMPEEGADPTSPRLVEEMSQFMANRDFALGVCWDGDCDRCVFFDGNGNLIPTYYIIGLLTEHFLREHPGRAIVFDTKLCWNTLDVIEAEGGVPIRSATGHAFVKRKMREHDAIYGGELSSHHFFGDFYYCDSGMFTWLTLMEVIRRAGQPIEELIRERRSQVCCTPEINLSIVDTDAAFDAIARHYDPLAINADNFDGPDYDMPGNWRFTLRQSKTEPLVRLNFESRGNPGALLDRVREVLAVLTPFEVNPQDHANEIRIQ